MKLKRLTQIMLVSCSILSLAACSSARKHPVDMAGAGSDMANASGAQTSGVDDQSNFGGGSGRHGLQQRTYYFDFDRFDVRAQDKPAIYANADYLIAHHGAKIIVEGHTDPRGSREYNIGLGERRANAVADLLKSRGVNPMQIRVVSYGAERLASPGRTESDYQMDRRAVIVYTRK